MGNGSITSTIKEKVESYGKCLSCCSSTIKRDEIDIQQLKQNRSNKSKALLLDQIHDINNINDIPLKTSTLKLIIGLKDVAQLNTGCSPNTTVDLLPEFVSTLPSVKKGEEVQKLSPITEQNDPQSVPELDDIVSDAISIMTDDNTSRRDSIIEYNRSSKAFTESLMDSDEATGDSDEDGDTDLIVCRRRSHLMRRQSSAQWHKDEIEKLKDEMADQLKFLQHSHTTSSSSTDLPHSRSSTMVIGNNPSIHSQIFSSSDTDESESDIGLRSTHNLLRAKSIDKWGQEEIDDETNDIRNELVRLVSPQDANGNDYCAV